MSTQDIVDNIVASVNNVLEDEIKEKMEGNLLSQPYQVTCEECGKDLKVTDRSLDSDGDLKIEVAPCSYCLEEAKESQS